MLKLESMCGQKKASVTKQTRMLTVTSKPCLAQHAGRLDPHQLDPQTDRLSGDGPFTHKALALISVCALE